MQLLYYIAFPTGRSVGARRNAGNVQRTRLYGQRDSVSVPGGRFRAKRFSLRRARSGRPRAVCHRGSLRQLHLLGLSGWRFKRPRHLLVFELSVVFRTPRRVRHVAHVSQRERDRCRGYSNARTRPSKGGGVFPGSMARTGRRRGQSSLCRGKCLLFVDKQVIALSASRSNQLTGT